MNVATTGLISANELFDMDGFGGGVYRNENLVVGWRLNFFQFPKQNSTRRLPQFYFNRRKPAIFPFHILPQIAEAAAAHPCLIIRVGP